jgi:hypothetical protein
MNVFFISFSYPGSSPLKRKNAMMRSFALLTLLVFLSAFPARAAAPTGDPVGPHQVACNVSEIMTEHLHAHLSIEARGKHVAIPANIGLVRAGGTPICIYWLHTHDASGLIHVEAPMGTFTLADFFAVWGEPLSSTQVGPYRGHVTATVNGKPFAGPPQSIPLTDGAAIVLRIL